MFRQRRHHRSQAWMPGCIAATSLVCHCSCGKLGAKCTACWPVPLPISSRHGLVGELPPQDGQYGRAVLFAGFGIGFHVGFTAAHAAHRPAAPPRRPTQSGWSSCCCRGYGRRCARGRRRRCRMRRASGRCRPPGPVFEQRPPGLLRGLLAGEILLPEQQAATLRVFHQRRVVRGSRASIAVDD